MTVGTTIASARSERLIEAALDVWPVPAGHRSEVGRVERRPKRKISLTDLIAAGLLEEAPRCTRDRTATVLSDGALDVDGVPHATPSGAARAVSGASKNGWWFWLVDAKSRRSLSDLWREYVDQRDFDGDDADLPDEDGDD